MFKTCFIFSCSMLLVLGAQARGVKIADVTRLSGQRTNVLTGLGLVIGLKGTGDGGDYLPAIQALASMLEKFSDKVTVEQLSKTQNVAIVNIVATIPSTGARNGDQIDVHIASAGAAGSLKGGWLFACPLLAPRPDAAMLSYALAQGPIDIEDASSPNVGVVHGGAVMETDIKLENVEDGKFKLIIEAPAASWTTASQIVKTINGAESLNGEELAVAIDAMEVQVSIPLSEREHPDSFISRVQQLPLIMLASEARVTINRRTGTMIVTGDVEISPAVISHQGLTISTVTPMPAPTQTNPQITTHQNVALDTANAGGARLQDLVIALDQLRVPINDRIDILVDLHRSGKLHAKLVEESN